MANILVTKEKIAEEDLNIGSGTFFRTTSTGGSQTLNKIGLETFAQGWINVQDYKAKGDGTTDDTSAINAAIAAATEDQVLFFPPGVYIISSTLDIDKSLSIIGDGAELKAASSLSGYMMNYHYGQEATAQRSQDTKQIGLFRGLIFNGNDSSNGLDLARVYRTLFEQVFMYNIKGTALRIDRVIESSFVNVTIQDCIKNGIEPLVDFEYDNTGVDGVGSDQTNMTSFISCSFNASSHPVFLNIKTATGATDFAVRDIRFFNCLFHGLTSTHLSDDPTRFTAFDNSLILTKLIECQHIEFYGCTWQLGGSTGTCVEFGASSQAAKHCQIFGGKMLEQGGSGTAINVVAIDLDTAYMGVLIDSDLTITDTASALKAPLITSRSEINHIPFDVSGGKVGLFLDNNTSAVVNNTSERSPKIQMRGPSTNSVFLYKQGATDPAFIAEVTNPHASSATRTLSYEVDATDGNTFLFQGDADEVMNVGKNTRGVRSLSLATLTAEPSDKHTGMVVLADGSSFDPLSVGSVHTALWDGSAWRAL